MSFLPLRLSGLCHDEMECVFAQLFGNLCAFVQFQHNPFVGRDETVENYVHRDH
jgi:hypothetical protein